MLSPDLFILQYGLNIVKKLKRIIHIIRRDVMQLELLKEISPGTPILVMGLTDMAEKEGDSIRSYQKYSS